MHAIIIQALSTLDKYASKLEKNASILYEEGVLKLLLPLISHTDLFIKRFAIKLLSELCFLPEVVEVLVNEEIIQSFMKILVNVSQSLCHLISRYKLIVINVLIDCVTFKIHTFQTITMIGHDDSMSC